MLFKYCSAILILFSVALKAVVAAPFPLQNAANEPFQAHVYLNPTQAKAPTVLALHGCGGMLNAKGEPNNRTNGYAKLLNAQGWHVVYIDSFTARGVKSVCGGANVATSAVTLTQRVQDVQALVAHVARQPYADPARIAILGWSHGGSTALLSTAKSLDYAVKPVATMVFYPGCGKRSVEQQWLPQWPVTMFLGAADDWTDPVPCQQIAAKLGLTAHTYPGAFHGFDSDAPVVQLKAIKSSMTGQGVHLGGNAAAKTAAQAELIAALKHAFK
jgi:dienelactone hydrolase